MLLLRNAIIRTVTGVSVIALGFISTPLMINLLGESIYGFWMLMTSVEALTGFLDFGLAVALSRSLAAIPESERDDNFSITVHSALAIHFLVACVVICVFIVLYFWTGLILNIDADLLSTARIILLLFAISTFFRFTMRTFEGIVMSFNRHYIVSIVELISNFARLGCLFIILYIKGNVLYIATLHVSLIFLSWIICYIAARRLAAPYTIFRIGWDTDKIKQLVTYSRNLSLSMVGSTLRNMLPFTILGRMSNLASVAQYGVANRLKTMGTNLSTQIFEPAMVSFAGLISQDKYEDARKLFYSTSLHACLFGGYLGLGIFFFSRPFIHLWVGAEFDVAAQATRIMALGVMILITMHPCALVLQSLAKQLITGVVDCCEAIIIIAALLAGAYQFGAIGAAYAFSGAIILTRPWVYAGFACHNLDISGFTLFKRAFIGPLLSIAIVFALYHFSAILFSSDTWLQFFAAGIIYSVLYWIVAFFVGMNSEIRKYWLATLTGYFQKTVRR